MKLVPLELRNLALSSAFPCARVNRDVMALITPFSSANASFNEPISRHSGEAVSNSSVISFRLGFPRRMGMMSESPTPSFEPEDTSITATPTREA